MHAFAWTVLGNDARLIKIDFARHSLDQRLRAGHDRGDLQRALQEAFKEKDAHRGIEYFTAAFRLSSSENTRPAVRVLHKKENFFALPKREFDFDSSSYNDEIVNNSCVSRRKLMKRCHA